MREFSEDAPMADEIRNVEVLTDAYRRWHSSKGGSVDHWMSIVDDNIQFGSIARGVSPLAFTQPVNNKEQLRGYFDGLVGDWEMLHYTINNYVAQGDLVFVRCVTSWRNRKTGKSFETPKADFWRFRDGKVVEFYEYYDTAQVMAAAV
jgi:ketosteroid isomerase-like protein